MRKAEKIISDIITICQLFSKKFDKNAIAYFTALF